MSPLALPDLSPQISQTNHHAMLHGKPNKRTHRLLTCHDFVGGACVYFARGADEGRRERRRGLWTRRSLRSNSSARKLRRGALPAMAAHHGSPRRSQPLRRWQGLQNSVREWLHCMPRSHLLCKEIARRHRGEHANDLQRQAKLGKVRKRVVCLGRHHQVGLVGDGRGEGRRGGEGES